MDGDVVRNGGFSLRSLLSDAEVVGTHDVVVSHCTTEPLACREGDAFVLLPGRDAEADVRNAVRLGAVAVVASQPVAGCPAPVCYVADAAEAYGRICQALAGRPSGRLKVVGVAGSYGKTTTGYLIASILADAGRTPGVLSSLGYCDGAETAEARWTTPPAPMFAAWLRRMADNGCTHAVVELSARGVMESRVAGVQFDVLCLTNLRADEGDSRACHVDRRRYAARLIEQLNPEGVLVVNADDPAVAAAAERHEGPIVTVGIASASELTATLVERCASEQTFCLSFGDEVVPVRTTLCGDHNILNCLTAAAVAAVYRIAPETIVRGIESVRELPGRLERIECGRPFQVFLDEARTPESLATCLQTLRATTKGRLSCVLGVSAEHDRSTRARFGRAADHWADETVVTQSPAVRAASEAFEDVLAGFRIPTRRRLVVDRADAIRQVLVRARPDDCVLIAGQGLETYSLADREQDYWDDRQLVRQTLYSLNDVEPPRRAA